MKRRPLSFAAILLALAGLPAAGLPESGVLLDGYAAIVNGKVVTVGDVLGVLQPRQERLAEQYDGLELEQKLLEEFEAVRDSLVESELILADFEMQGGTLPDRAIENHLNTVLHERFGNDRAALFKALSEERLTLADWRKQMKDQLIVQIMRQREVSAKILVAPLDLQTAYDRRRAEFAVPERVRLRTLSFSDPAAALPVRDNLLSGAVSFEDAAPTAALQDDGEFIETASLAEPLRDALAGLDAGGISPPVEIGGATYLVQLVERQPARVRPLGEVAAEIEKDLRRAEFERLGKIWLDSLRSKYYVQVFTHNLFE
ncbi:MAG: peptidyl-prolyl cis-trans isomerase [Kiritimatiellia bacterium]